MRLLVPSFVGAALTLAAACSSSSSSSSSSGGYTDPGAASSGTPGTSSGVSSSGTSGSTIGGFPLGCTLEMPVDGPVVSATLVQSQEILTAGVFLGKGPAPFEGFSVYFGLKKPLAATAGDLALDSLRIELRQEKGKPDRVFIAPAGACTVTIEEVQDLGDQVAYKGSGSCTSDAVEKVSSGGTADAGEAGAPATLTVGAFTFSNSFFKK